MAAGAGGAGARSVKVPRPRVLIVDDNALNTELAAFILAGAGVDVDAASDAMQALARLAAADRALPDLILMDIQMAGMDGLALTRQLKADPKTRGIVVVAFTAYAMRGDEARFRDAGCDGYISKPIDVAKFAGTVLSFIAPGSQQRG
jgi:two-component system, cell cycle response regulator DivK